MSIFFENDILCPFKSIIISDQTVISLSTTKSLIYDQPHFAHSKTSHSKMTENLPNKQVI